MLEIEAQCGTTPRALLDKPTLNERNVGHWLAYRDLNNSRTYGMSMANPIQISEIKAWLELTGEDDADTRALTLRHVKTLDAMFFERETAKPKKL